MTNLKGLILLHGYSNEVVPLEWAEDTMTFLKNLLIRYDFQTFASGHVFSAEMFYAVKTWIEENSIAENNPS